MPKGPVKRYCVMCLADGDKAAATHIIDGAGYCKPCLAVMERNGHGPAYTLEEYEQAAKPTRKKLSPAQRVEIAASSKLVPATVIARMYGVTGQTIANIRKEFPEEGPMREELLQPIEELSIPDAEEFDLPLDPITTPEPAPTPASTAPDDSVPESWEVSISVPSDRANDIFATFTTQERFDAIGFVLQRRMDDALNA